jgi:hypothetical protein
MVIDPHLNMFKNRAPGVRGPLSVLSDAPDQLKAFSVLGEIDCAQPYQGTIFRFPLRTEEQEPDSKLSDYAYTPAKVTNLEGGGAVSVFMLALLIVTDNTVPVPFYVQRCWKC